MTDNTLVPWTANELSLHTMAWSVKSFGGKRFFGPSKRGEDLIIPFKRGRVYTPKGRESQLYQLNMWVLPLNVDGTRDGTLTREQKAHENWRRIIAAVDIEGQFPLIKRWWDGDQVVAAAALAEFVEGDGPSRDDGTGFDFGLTFLLADPYFYAPVASQPVGTVTIEGEVPTDHMTLTLTGGTNPRVTLPDGNWIQYNGTVGGTPVVIDMRQRSAKIGSTYVNGLITRKNSFREWLTLRPGEVAMEYSGGGSASFTYDAAYR